MVYKKRGTVAAIDSIAGAMIGLVKQQFINAPSMIIALVTILVLLRFKKVQEPFVILAAALVGLAIKHWL